MGSMPDEHNDVPVGRPSSLRPVPVGRRRWRRAFRAALLLGLAGAALVLLAHTPPARAYVLRQAAAWLRARHGLVLAAGRLDYRLTSLTLSLHAISLSAAGAQGPPFLRAERITVLLSPRALTGRPAFRRIEVVAPRLAFGTGPERRHEPPPGEAGVGGLAWLDSLEIGTLAVRDLDLVAGRPDTVEVRVSGASLDASGDGPGRLRARVGVARDNFLVAPGTRVRLDELAGDVALVGSTVEVERLTARLPGGRLAIGGRVHLAAPRALDLRYAGEVDLGELQRWFVARLPLRGRAAVAGAVTGTLGEPRATFEATGTNVAWADGPEATMSASGAVSRRGLEVESLAVRAPSVTAAGRGHVAFARDDGPSRLAAEWRVGNARALAPLFEVSPDRLPPAGVSGSIALRWPGSVPSLVSVAGTVRADVLAHADSGGRPGDVVLDGGDGHWRWRQRQALGRTRSFS